MTIWILGGGPAGLALAHGIAANGTERFVLLEKGQELGGLARTLTWEGHGRHDLGPHKIFTTDAELMERVRALLPESAWLTRPKRSRIYMHGHYLPYPPSPISLAAVFGWPTFVRMVSGYIAARLRPPRAEMLTFEDDLRARVGKTLFELLFAPIARKLWDEPSRLDVRLSRGRVQTPPLSEVILQTLRIKRRSSEFEALEFAYPQGGLQGLWDSIASRSGARGEFRTGVELTGIHCNHDAVQELRVRNATSGADEVITVEPADFVVSTLPLGLLVSTIEPPLSAAVISEARSALQLNDLLLVFFHVGADSLMEDSWIFVPDPDIVFHRISEQESFDPGMVPSGSIVCCEIMSGPARDLAACSDDDLVERCLAGLRRMGFAPDVLASRVIRLPRSYPVFRPGYERRLEAVLQHLDAFGNLRTIGRQGAFNYIGTLDAMDIGYGAARWLTTRATAGTDAWQEERRRTNHYAVLD